MPSHLRMYFHCGVTHLPIMMHWKRGKNAFKKKHTCVAFLMSFVSHMTNENCSKIAENFVGFLPIMGTFFSIGKMPITLFLPDDF